MKRPFLPEPRCISRPHRLTTTTTMMMMCLLLIPSLPSAESSSPPAPSGLSRLLPWSRKPLARRHHGRGLHQGLVTEWLIGKAVPPELGEKQPEGSLSSQPRRQILPSARLGPQQDGDGLLHPPFWAAVLRQKRHAAGRLHHAQLMRVGCALGTCQVQNLSHRLWQLQGQSGRHDVSPMNPNSPHSYG
nr:ADM2 [Pogona vitticeps]